MSQLERRGDRLPLSVLYALSLSAETASREALGYAAGINERATDRNSALTVLTDLSLANFVHGRFSLLPLTREYVGGELGRDLVSREPAVQPWLEWHLTLTARCHRRSGLGLRHTRPPASSAHKCLVGD